MPQDGAALTMLAQPQSHSAQSCDLALVARFPHLRVLAWSGDQLYAARGYDLLRAQSRRPAKSLTWNPVATFHPGFPRELSSSNRLSARLFRDGFHALAVLSSGGMVAAVPRSIITLRPNETEFHISHAITRGTRPLHITAVPQGAVYWGEYFDNPARDEVHIYGSTDGGLTWAVAYTFAKKEIRHVHNIVHDPWENCLWISTGDYGDECRILRASCGFTQVEIVLQGNQQARAVALVPTAEGLYFSSDTPLEHNFIYRLDRKGADRQQTLARLVEISSSSIYACQVAGRIFFSTMVEPSEVNRDPHVRIFGNTSASTAPDWKPLLAWRKDSWSTKFFQYGNAFLPDGNNSTPYLAVTTIAVEGDDMVTSLYDVNC
ncbi:MAG: hypothetical protein WAN03_11640 [Candidatus Sulfotelmatobacter sp.]